MFLSLDLQRASRCKTNLSYNILDRMEKCRMYHHNSCPCIVLKKLDLEVEVKLMLSIKYIIAFEKIVIRSPKNLVKTNELTFIACSARYFAMLSPFMIWSTFFWKIPCQDSARAGPFVIFGQFGQILIIILAS